MSLHDVAPEAFADTCPAGHEAQLVCAPIDVYLPFGQLVHCEVPVAAANRPVEQSLQELPLQGLYLPVAQAMHLFTPQFAVLVHTPVAVPLIDLPEGHPLHA